MDKARQRARNIGMVLLHRRIQLDLTHHRTRAEWVETVRCAGPLDNPHQTVADIESGARVPQGDALGYDEVTLDTLEKAYQLKPGSLGEALQGGHLTAADSEHLYPPPRHPDFKQ